MKAIELRLENWIKHLIFENVQIKGINEEGLKIEHNNNLYWDDFEYYKPIPLTEQWLKDFGFIQDERWIQGWNKGKFRLWQTLLSGKTVFYYDFRNGDYLIKHVHQLQNLYFVLTKKELIKKTL